MEERKPKKTVLEIGCGPKFERATKTASEHPTWKVIAVDPDLERITSPLSNLTLIRGKFDPSDLPRNIKVDLVQFFHTALPHVSNEIFMPTLYSWMGEEHDWLADKHEIHVIDNGMSNYYYRHRESFDRTAKQWEEKLARKGYRIKLEEIPREDYEKLSFYDTFISTPIHVRVKFIKE